MELRGYDMQAFMKIEGVIPFCGEIVNLGGGGKGDEGGDEDDYTDFRIYGDRSTSTQEETLQLQRTSFMRENDGNQEMSAKSFEHCIEQVVRFHFPQDRSLHFTHWNAGVFH